MMIVCVLDQPPPLPAKTNLIMIMHVLDPLPRQTKLMMIVCVLDPPSPQKQIPYPRERGPTTECRPDPHFGLNFQPRSNVYSNVRPCVAALENAAQKAGL